MRLRNLSLVLAASAAITPVVASATPEKDALNACAHAFAASLAGQGTAAPAFKLAYHGNQFSGSMMEFYNREYTFELRAHDPKTGLPLARASCSTDIHGTVVGLSAMPVAAAHPSLVADF